MDKYTYSGGEQRGRGYQSGRGGDGDRSRSNRQGDGRGYGGGGGGGEGRGRDERGGGNRGPCNDFRRTGNCRFGDKCKFDHSGGGGGGSSFGGGGGGRGRSERGSSRGYGGRDDRGRGGGRGNSGFGGQQANSSVAPGQPVPLYVNYHKLKMQGQRNVYVYGTGWGGHIGISDNQKKISAYRNAKKDLNNILGHHLAWDNNVYSTVNVPEPFTVFANVEGEQHEIHLQFQLEIDLDDLNEQSQPHMLNILSLFNSVVKQALRQKKYNQIGRFPKFFNPADKIEIRQYDLNAWPGYEVTSKKCVQGVFLNIESCTKFINMVSVLKMYKEQLSDGYRTEEIFGKYDSSNVEIPRQTVITEHNSKAYQVDGMTTNYNPLTHIFHDKKAGKDISMSEYFLKTYKINLIDKQPLLYVNQRSGERIYLPTQICHEASLPKDFTRDQYKMRQIQEYKITSAEERRAKILKLAAKFADDATFREWGVELTQEMMDIKGTKLGPPAVEIEGDRTAPFQDFANFKIPHTQPLRLDHEQWAFAYSNRDVDIVNQLIATFEKASKAMKMRFGGEPIWIEVPESRDLEADGLKKQDQRDGGGFNFCINNELDGRNLKQIAIVFVLVQRDTDKAKIKMNLDKKGMASQFILLKNLNKNIGKMSVISNLIRQVNAKCGMDLYRLRLPQKIVGNGTMVVGVDVHNMGVRSIIGMTASYNRSTTQYFSRIAYQHLHKEMVGKTKDGRNITKDEQEEVVTTERTQIFAKFMKEAFEFYVKKNKGNQPKQIIIYRDGIGGPTMRQKTLREEGPGGQLTQAIKNFAPGYDPKILYIFVDKKISTRLFEKQNGHVINPGPGTLVDQGIVEEDGRNTFDFFMISNNNPKTATALPVHYSVAMNTTSMNKEEIEQFTHHQCYNYYGFGGPIKTPACVKYAQKMAAYTHDNGFSQKNLLLTPNDTLNHRLHYL